MSDLRVRSIRSLRLRWGLLALATTGGIAAVYVGIAPFLSDDHAGRWLVGTGAVLAVELGLLWYFIPRNHGDGEALAPSFGPATLVTLLRGVFVACLAGFLLVPWLEGPLAWAPVSLYAAAATLDAVDGALARATDRATVLGARLDTEIDALGVLLAVSLAVGYGQLPLPFLAIGFARYVFVVGSWFRRLRGLPVYDLPSRRIGRTLAGLQMAVLAVALLPVVSPSVATLLATLVAVPFLAGFLRDWLHHAGHLGRAEHR
ncbi:CDP-alcohol phosphatidyltransferase family protein [Natronorarus salvus]|uniref:CDP-alcohol phosphatidyltransferase family protein n=1 Tax=Natronorarus salvus TaxID=3117733 RepID=UPI002F26C27E